MMRRALTGFYIVLWLSIIVGSGVFAYQGIKTHANAWEDSHPEYCTNQYDYRCGQKNPWGSVFFIWLISFPLAICFGSAWINPRVEKLIDQLYPKDGS